ncbi:Cilia- and flagella-associated protein 161 [Hondaea fermentalgiana]|uniref:Cilia-and flagella-associated protein 161 n=1 Tax=Hondaea fermentalgiana TaxID=2315210 RepID=A0A2R5GGF5_9STRA|nr:Cilia- and flagella-associated protein 161 [Hondaea fermentalgiana]|eukprot:GBG28838.1 Cilia- and flagella-associated protein 161 [Hondaea fermentalgiana]
MSRYSAKVLIGNWNEDKSLADIQKKLVQHNVNQGTRLVDQVDSATAAGREPAQLSWSEDGLLRYGFLIALKHGATGRRLASNVSNEVEARKFQASGVENQSLRTSFVIQRPRGVNLFAENTQDDFVRFGDEVILATAPSLRLSASSGLFQKQLYVFSSPSSLLGSTSQSGEQEVRIAKEPLVTKDEAYMRWRIEPMLSQPFPVGADTRVACDTPLQLVHCASGKALAMDAATLVYNDYGPELDVFCTLDQATRKVHVLKHEARGVRTADHRLPVLARNAWTFELADSPPSLSQDELGAPLSADAVLALVSEAVQAEAPSFADHMRSFDEAGDDMLDRVQFKYALLDAGLDLTADEIEVLTDSLCLDAVERDAISVSDFLARVLEGASVNSKK